MGRLKLTRRRGLDDEAEEEEAKEVDLRPEKVGMVRVERETRSDDGLEEPW